MSKGKFDFEESKSQCVFENIIDSIYNFPAVVTRIMCSYIHDSFNLDKISHSIIDVIYTENAPRLQKCAFDIIEDLNLNGGLLTDPIIIIPKVSTLYNKFCFNLNQVMETLMNDS